MAYKIYKRNNQVFIDDITTSKKFSGTIGIIEIIKNPIDTSYFSFLNFNNLPESEILLENIKKENGDAYTTNEWETFYTSLSQELTTSPPVGGATEDKQDTGNSTLNDIKTANGAPSDAAATTDTGTFSIIAFIKRGLQNWTALLAKIPALGGSNSAGSIPVVQSFETASGTITTRNLVPFGVATPGSAVEIELKGAAQVSLQLVGVYTTALSVQFTIDGITWETSTNALGIVSETAGTSSATIASATQGIFKVECNGMTKVRITALAAFTGSVTVNLRAMPNTTLFGLNASAIIASGTITVAGTPAVPATPYFKNSTADTNGALIFNGTSGLHAFFATNIGATVAFVKLYNKATAPTVGTDVPEMIITVPAAVGGVPGTANLPIGFNGFRFPLGLGIAITGAFADSDTTAVAAGQVKVKLSRTV